MCDGMTRSTARAPVKADREPVQLGDGLPQLRLSEEERGKTNRERSSTRHSHGRSRCCSGGRVIGDAYVEDPATRTRYALESIAEDMLMMRVTPPAHWIILTPTTTICCARLTRRCPLRVGGCFLKSSNADVRTFTWVSFHFRHLLGHMYVATGRFRLSQHDARQFWDRRTTCTSPDFCLDG